MQFSQFEFLATLRSVIGYLGEHQEPPWWPSRFFAPGNGAFLSPSFPRTQTLAQGSFIFRGEHTPVATLSNDVLEASNTYLGTAAKEVFDRYSEAPVRVDTTLAEKFLRIGNLKAITTALLVGGEIKLKVSGREVTVNGQQAVEALRTNNAFKIVGVSLREGRPSNELLARAATRLTDVIGETVLPLEDEISKAAAKQFPQFQHRFGPLAERLASLELPGVDTVRTLNQELADVLLTDASDAPQRLGAEESALYESLKWAIQVEASLKQGLEITIRDLQQHRREIEKLPDTGPPGQLRQEVQEELALVRDRLDHEDFRRHAADLNTSLTRLQARTRDAASRMAAAQQQTVKEAQQDIQRLAEWPELTQEEQSQAFAQLDGLTIEPTLDLDGLAQLLRQEYVISSRLGELKKQIEQRGRQRQREKLEEEKVKVREQGQFTLQRSLRIPAAVTTAAQLDDLIRQLQLLKDELAAYSDMPVKIELDVNPAPPADPKNRPSHGSP